jgi:hypothetical protein
MKRAIALLVATALLTQPLVVLADKPTPTEAQKAEARARYDRGLKLYDQGAFEAALVEMRRAYELAPAFKILYNLGLIHRQLNDHAASLDAFNQYLAEGGKKIDAKRHAEIEHHIADLKPLVATLTITVDVEGAEITIDDAVVGTSPLAAPISVNAGKRKISAKVAGKPPATRVITVAGSDAVNVKLELSEAAQKTPPIDTTAAKPQPTKPKETSRPVPWVAWGVTGVFVVGAVTTGILAMTSASALDDKRSTPNVSKDDLDSAASRTKTFALVTDILIVGTIAAAGVATYLTIKAPKANDTASTTVRVGVAPTGFAIVGSF